MWRQMCTHVHVNAIGQGWVSSLMTLHGFFLVYCFLVVVVVGFVVVVTVIVVLVIVESESFPEHGAY